MQRYQAWYELDSLSLLNGHLNHLSESMSADSCLMVSFLTPSVEVPIYKRSFKKKPSIVAPLIRTSSIGREELRAIRDQLQSFGYTLRLRHSPKKRYLSKVSVQIPSDDQLMPVHVQKVLEVVADAKSQPMSDSVIVGYFHKDFSPHLPGRYHLDNSLNSTMFKVGKKLGETLQ